MSRWRDVELLPKSDGAPRPHGVARMVSDPYDMPGMDGFELAAALQDSAKGWTGRLGALAGYGQEADKAHSREAGFAAHLTKPVNLDVLLAEIERLVRPPARLDGSAMGIG